LQVGGGRLDDGRKVELVRWEYQQRWKRGDRAARSDYARQFPDLSAALNDLKPRWNCRNCKRKGIVLDDEGCGHCRMSPLPCNGSRQRAIRFDERTVCAAKYSWLRDP